MKYRHLLFILECIWGVSGVFCLILMEEVAVQIDYMSDKSIPKTLITVIPSETDKFFYLADHSPPKDIPNAFFFNIDDDLVYEGFFEDFGPLNLAKIWKYINEVHKFLTDEKFSKNTFYHFTSPHYSKSSNSALLICAYLVVIQGKTPEQAYQPFGNVEFRPFRDAGYGQCNYKCTILDCLRGLHYAIRLGWFDYKKFDIAEYQHYEKIENGDINWIIPGKFVALSSPYDHPLDESGTSNFTPKDYIPIFKKMGVTTVVRLNNQTYDSSEFKKGGIRHYELYFTDGTCPPKNILLEFLSIAEKEPGAIAVHCKAGLGRTGTLIACYAIKHYHFNAADFIGWIRLCRPGSVLGPQQFFLLESEQWLKAEGQKSPIWREIKERLTQAELSAQLKNMSLGTKGKMSEQEKSIGIKGQYQQGNKLVEAKKNKKR